MIGYAMLGTKDIKKAAAFYDAIAEIVGAERKMDFGHAIFWQAPGGAMLGVTEKAANGQPVSVGNGVMMAFGCPDTGMVQKIFNKAMELGGADEGGPGERAPGFYAAYFRDLDGNKLAATAHG